MVPDLEKVVPNTRLLRTASSAAPGELASDPIGIVDPDAPPLLGQIVFEGVRPVNAT
jgi:hypothetical protein